MVGRLFWVLARDDATPFSKYFSQVNERLSCPIPATILCAVFCTALGAIQLGSATAFNWMGDAGYVVNGIACALIIFFNIFFCFPYAYPVEPISAMNCES
jgi:choline transport protein